MDKQCQRQRAEKLTIHDAGVVVARRAVVVDRPVGEQAGPFGLPERGRCIIQDLEDNIEQRHLREQALIEAHGSPRIRDEPSTRRQKPTLVAA